MYYLLNNETHQITEFDTTKQSLDDALRIMKKMRWVKIKRRGRSGHRRFEVRLRNRDEWKQGYIVVDGQIRARLV